jgi:general secretion pathway protein H
MKTGTSGTDRPPGRPSSAGFTLLELLAVLAIIALVAATLSLRTGKTFGVAYYRAVLTSTSAIMRQARSRAISNAQSQIVVIDVEGRKISIPATGQGFSIPPEVDMLATVAESERYPDGTVGIRFFGDGSSTGGTLAYAWRGQKYEIQVNWLTGHVGIHQS